MSEAVSDAESAASDSVVRELTAFQQNILVVLAEEPRYGLAIKRTLEEYYGTEVNHGRLYPNLDNLVEMELVEKSELDKRTNQYELTEAGREALLGRLDWVLGKYVTDEDHVADIQELVEKYA
jgi:DNA-binding PadR family transcriptional regulator